MTTDHIPSVLHYGILDIPVERKSLGELGTTAPEEEGGEPMQRYGNYQAAGPLVELVRSDERPSARMRWIWLFHEMGHHGEEVAGQDLDDKLLDWLGWFIFQLLAQNPGLQEAMLRDLAG